MGVIRNAEFPLDGTRQINADGSITADQMLKEPTRITRYVTDVIQANSLADKIYSGGGVSGGVILFNQIRGKINPNASALRSGVIAPGGEFPEINQSEISEELTRVKKIGNSVTITDEAVKRNDVRFLQSELRKMSIIMAEDLDSDAIDAFDKAMAHPDVDNQFVESNGWVKYNKTKAADLVAADSIAADIEALRLKTKTIGLGYNYTTLLLNPADASRLRLAVGISNVPAFLSQWGYTIEETNLITEGEGWLLAPKQIGYMGVETPISTEVDRDPGHQSTTSYTWATVGHAITDPYALVKITGLIKDA